MEMTGGIDLLLQWVHLRFYQAFSVRQGENGHRTYHQGLVHKLTVGGQGRDRSCEVALGDLKTASIHKQIHTHALPPWRFCAWLQST